MKGRNGQTLPIVMITLVILTLIISGLVTWMQNDSKWSVKEQKSTTAINCAEAGIDRATWKLQSTTDTWATAAAGLPLPGGGYAFDRTFTDLPGGSYRIKLSPGPLPSEVTVLAEGRDSSTKEMRAILAVYKNQTIYSPLMAGGGVSWSQGLGVYWGPIISQGDIVLLDDNVARRYFPQKYAKGVVTTGPAVSAVYQNRDLNGLAPPNTDNIEWWSDYAGVPGLPLLDFAALRSSAAATGTLNVYGCASSGQYTIDGTPVPGWDARGTCDSTNPNHAIHLGNSTNFYATRGLDPAQNYVWYWDGDVSLEGDGYNGTLATSLRGTVIVRGNLTIDSSGDMVYSGHVPANAWQQEQKLLVNTFDTSAPGEYPADIDFHKSTGTWHFGVDSWNEPGLGGGWVNTVGIQGFVYVGGNVNIINFLDIHGAIWVNGNVVSAYNNPSAFCGIFYDDTLQVPALNVILQRQSWQEVPLSSTPWP